MSDATRNVIRDTILGEGQKYQEFGEPVPSSWIALQEKLIGLKRDNKIIVQLDEIKQINSQMNIPLSDGELKVFLKVFHNMGYALYFDLSILGDKGILGPKLVIDSMRSFITCERFIPRPWKKWQFNQMRRSGRIKISHVHGMLKEKCGSNISEHSEHLLGIIEQHYLVCQPMSYNKGSKVSPDFYLVPCIMSADMPLAPLELNRESGLIITFSSERTLPPAIFNRLVCSCLSLWEIFDHHFYNGLVVVRSGKFHPMEMKREIRQIVVTLSHTESTKRPDAEWCLAIKLFLTATIEKIVAVYSTSL
ncbi:hypothetical protein FSP39_005615 [Pinctada imbricata]|uniref:Uncharacterized protein n=1 Tax=Pinctada imbricata TaxID=66713 RepID=A0AA88YP25_PINIB|nr:hypothetical protein FSP39_005615 [Pinctada imbricata]